MRLDISILLLSALAALVTLTVHEFSHGLMAYKLGDPTAKLNGRLTFNPLRHIDPVGALCMVLFHFGWARPVPINTRYFKKPRRDIALCALAGPLSNIILAFISGLFYLLLLNAFSGVRFESRFAAAAVQFLIIFVYLLQSINIGIAIFNLIPVPPLDGSRILGSLLPPKAYYSYMRYERQLYFALLGWLLLGDIVKSGLLSVPFIAANPVLSFTAGIFSLGDMLSWVMMQISDLILSFWSLFPFI